MLLDVKLSMSDVKYMLKMSMFLAIVTTSVTIKSHCNTVVTTLVGQWEIFYFNLQ